MEAKVRAPRPWLRAFGNLAAGESVTSVLRLSALLLIARRLGPSNFGTVSVGFVVGGYLVVLANPGLATVGTRAVAAAPSDARHWLAHIVGLRATFALGVYALTVATVIVVSMEHDLRVVLLVFALVIVTQSLDVRWVFIGLQRTRPVAVASVLGGIAYLGLVVLLVRGPGDLGIVAFAYICGEAVISSALLVASRWRLGQWSPRLHARSSRALLRESTPLGLAAAGRALTVSLDVILVKALRPADEAGFYAAASRMMVVGLLYLGLYYSAMLPSAVQAARKSPAALRAVTKVAARRVLIFGPPILIVGVVSAHTVVPTVLGHDYEPTAGLLQVLLVALWLVALNGVVNNNLIACGRDRVFALIVPVSLVINVTANAILLPTIGTVGAAVATVITEGITLILGVIALSARFGE